ncbi:MAG: SpoIID/LytB domain-containing protein [candidate division Zixibacteria bacterium]|nr:SpoIID/LytB domain-containing protein [candidate division Zixibacteria bacterium]
MVKNLRDGNLVVKAISSAPFIIFSIFGLGCVPGSYGSNEERTAVVKLPFVRVLLSDNLSEVTLGGRGSISIESVRDDESFIYYSSGSIKLQISGPYIALYNSSGEEIESGLEQVTVSSRSRWKYLRLGDNKYRGMIRALPIGGRLTLVNILYVEDYLKGVVPPEIGPVTEADTEAIKAQAIAARTYTLAHFGQYQNKPYDVKSDVSDQLYLGMNVERDLITGAVKKTEGIVARFDGEFIKAYYHSTCGGYTDNIENVWSKDPAPYLVSVSCSSMCQPSKYYNWTETFSSDDFLRRLSTYESSLKGKTVSYSRIDSIGIDNSFTKPHGPGLRTQDLIVIADGQRLVYQRDRIRWVLGRASNPERILQSDYFKIGEISYAKDGSISSITLLGKGYGHGVGMCQMGALGMARLNTAESIKYTYNQIIKRYYQGATLDKLY